MVTSEIAQRNAYTELQDILPQGLPGVQRSEAIIFQRDRLKIEVKRDFEEDTEYKSPVTIRMSTKVGLLGAAFFIEPNGSLTGRIYEDIVPGVTAALDPIYDRSANLELRQNMAIVVVDFVKEKINQQNKPEDLQL